MPGFDYVTYNDVDELRTKVKDARGGLLGKGKSRLAAIMLEPLQVLTLALARTLSLSLILT